MLISRRRAVFLFSKNINPYCPLFSVVSRRVRDSCASSTVTSGKPEIIALPLPRADTVSPPFHPKASSDSMCLAFGFLSLRHPADVLSEIADSIGSTSILHVLNISTLGERFYRLSLFPCCIFIRLVREDEYVNTCGTYRDAY